MNYSNRIIQLVTVVLLSFQVNAQQEPRSAFFWNNYMHTNPAMTGAKYKHQAISQWRNQWDKTNGAPATLWVNYAAKIDKINSGLGVSYEYDVIGITRAHTGLLSYAYHLPIKNAYMSIGLSAGVRSIGYKKEDLIYYLPADPFQIKNSTNFHSDFGLAFHGENWNTGISITQLNGYFQRNNQLVNSAPHYWIFGDYTFQLGQNWSLTPRLQLYTDLHRMASSEAIIATWKDRLWFGAISCIPFGRGNFAVGPTIGYDILGKFRLGYAYELWMNNIPGQKNNSTHEVIFSFQLK